jgi:hypothetical protein
MNGISGGDTTKQSVIHGVYTIRVGHNHITIRCKNGNIGKEITKYTVIYNVYVQFWPTLEICAGKAATATSKRKNLTSSL